MQIDPTTLSPGRRYFLMTSCIIPRPIAWVGTLNEDGTHNLAPFSYFNGLSGTPPIVGIGMSSHEDKGEKDTLRNIRRTGELSISIPHAGLVDQVEACSDDLPYGSSEFEHASLSPTAGEVIRAPLLKDAQISFECTLYQLVPLGEGGSTLVLAEIRMFHILDTLLDDRGCVNGNIFQGLARMSGGRYATLSEIFKVER